MNKKNAAPQQAKNKLIIAGICALFAVGGSAFWMRHTAPADTNTIKQINAQLNRNKPVTAQLTEQERAGLVTLRSNKGK